MDKLKLIEAILQGGCSDSGIPFAVGECVFIRTVTHHLTGRITAINGAWLTLADAAWIADDGRFMAAIENGTLGEVEPVTCPVRVNMESAIDAYPWRHALPREQK